MEILPIHDVPEIHAGDDLADALASALGPGFLRDSDVLVVTQKVVSKSEGRFAPLEEKDEAVTAESTQVLRRTGSGMVISETRHGFVCANAGVDTSNVPGDQVVLLPVDPDLSARRIRARLRDRVGVDVGVVISDTFGRAWRLGQTDIAIGVAGINPFIDHTGSPDSYGQEMHATRICVADELASAAELVMGKTSGICAALIRGSGVPMGRGSASEIVRPRRDDLFR